MKQDMEFDLVRALDPLVRYRPMEELLSRLELPRKLLPEPITNVVPTVVVRADGLSLASVVLVSASLLCEVRLTPHPHNFDFDVVRKKITNYRVRTWEQEIKEGDTIKQRYLLAEVNLVHSLGGGFGTLLQYAGDDRDDWLQNIFEAFPMTVMLE